MRRKVRISSFWVAALALVVGVATPADAIAGFEDWNVVPDAAVERSAFDPSTRRPVAVS